MSPIFSTQKSLFCPFSVNGTAIDNVVKVGAFCVRGCANKTYVMAIIENACGVRSSLSITC